MRNLLFFILLTIHVLTILFFTQIQDLFFNTHFSWTFSKMSGYLSVLLTALSLLFFLPKKLRSLKWYFKLPSYIFICTLGFIIAFTLNPIYEGDFKGQGTKLKNNTVIHEINGDFVMIALLDCPYCHEAIQTLNKIQKRNPKMKISLVVLTAHPENLLQYSSKTDKRIAVKTTHDFEAITTLAGGSYPAFFQVKSGKITEVWSNDQFGMPAIDRIEMAE